VAKLTLALENTSSYYWRRTVRF